MAVEQNIISNRSCRAGLGNFLCNDRVTTFSEKSRSQTSRVGLSDVSIDACDKVNAHCWAYYTLIFSSLFTVFPRSCLCNLSNSGPAMMPFEVFTFDFNCGTSLLMVETIWLWLRRGSFTEPRT
jgi:hypothetical protein